MCICSGINANVFIMKAPSKSQSQSRVNHTRCVPPPNPTTIPDACTTLPRHPETVCGALEVRTAFARCKLLGPVEACCEGLDAVFANSSSPANG